MAGNAASPSTITSTSSPANKRLSTNERGQVIYSFKQPFRDGTTHVVLDPIDCIARLAALVPLPRNHHVSGGYSSYSPTLGWRP